MSAPKPNLYTPSCVLLPPARFPQKRRIQLSECLRDTLGFCCSRGRTRFYVVSFGYKGLTSNPRRLPSHRRRLRSNRRWIPSNRHRLPFQRRPIVCLDAAAFRTAGSVAVVQLPEPTPQCYGRWRCSLDPEAPAHAQCCPRSLDRAQRRGSRAPSFGDSCLPGDGGRLWDGPLEGAEGAWQPGSSGAAVRPLITRLRARPPHGLDTPLPHSKGAYRALCARCAKFWLFSTAGSSVRSEE